MLFSFIQVDTQGSNSEGLLSVYSLGIHSAFIHSAFNGYLGCFQFLTMINNAAINVLHTTLLVYIWDGFS